MLGKGKWKWAGTLWKMDSTQNPQDLIIPKKVYPHWIGGNQKNR